MCDAVSSNNANDPGLKRLILQTHDKLWSHRKNSISLKHSLHTEQWLQLITSCCLGKLDENMPVARRKLNHIHLNR